MDATHPQHNPIIGCAWIKRGEDYPIKSNTGHQRLNINGAIEIQTYTAQIRFDVTIDAASTIALFQQIEKANPYAKRLSFQSARCLFACLTLSRLELLDTLRRSGPRSIDELARHAERDPVTAGADVARLGELGLIDQAPDGSVSVPFDAVEIQVPLARVAWRAAKLTCLPSGAEGRSVPHPNLPGRRFASARKCRGYPGHHQERAPSRATRCRRAWWPAGRG